MTLTRITLSAAAVMLAACASAPPSPAPPTLPSGAPAPPPATPGAAVPLPSAEPPPRPSLGLFSRIKAPDAAEPAFELAATGVQIFRCEPDQNGFHWAYRLPEAELRDNSGHVLARHGTGYSFEHTDGSRLLGKIVAHDAADSSGSVPWLLLQTQSFGQGEFEKINYVQRIDTQGGMPPAQCSADQVNQVLRVPFSANFVFYRPH
jgi:hypothetical protein